MGINQLSRVAIGFGQEVFEGMVRMSLDSALEHGKSALAGLLWAEMFGRPAGR